VLVEEYFREIEGSIADCPYVAKSYIEKDKRSFHVGIIEGRIEFTDGSLLHFLEFVSVKDEVNKYKYSYHFQAKNHQLIFRYDVAPHHKDIKSFPHHKHLGSGEVIAAAAPNLKEVLQEIETVLAGTLESC
jgi:hypothetical protein